MPTKHHFNIVGWMSQHIISERIDSSTWNKCTSNVFPFELPRIAIDRNDRFTFATCLMVDSLSRKSIIEFSDDAKDNVGSIEADNQSEACGSFCIAIEAVIWCDEKHVGFKLAHIRWQHCKLIDSVTWRIVRFRCAQPFNSVLDSLSSAIKHWLWNACVHAMQTHDYKQQLLSRWLCVAHRWLWSAILSKR